MWRDFGKKTSFEVETFKETIALVGMESGI